MTEARVNVSDPERWVSAAGGSALFIYGLRRRDPAGFLLAGLGAALFYRGASGHCQVREAIGHGAKQLRHDPGQTFLSIHKAVTIDKQPHEAFDYWRNLANLPRFMDHLHSVTVNDDKHSHWIAKAPLGKTIAWDTEIIRETRGRFIEWRSVSGGEMESSGSVRFSKRQNGRGTKVHYSFRYEPPANSVGLIVSKLFGTNPAKQVQQELHKFKQVIEAV
ncbi:MAG: SRPBCC family protein [Acidobacteriota bacterium]|nr:SRPBCC family protein [Acidobacteriota bacterium]